MSEASPSTLVATTPAFHAAASPRPASLTSLQRAAARRGRALLDAADPAAEMARLTSLEAFWAVKEVGLHDAGPLLAGLRDEQMQACLDLDCWRDEQLDPATFDAWLAAATRARGETQDITFHEALAVAFLAIDEEVAVIFLSRSLGICERQEDDHEAPLDPTTVEAQATADHTLWVWSTAEQRREVEPLVLVDALYRQAPATARRLLLAAQWELPAQLSEEAWHFRQARLEDLGFPPAQTAAQLWARPCPPEALGPADASCLAEAAGSAAALGPAAHAGREAPADARSSAGGADHAAPAAELPLGPGLPAVIAQGLTAAQGHGDSELALALGVLHPAAVDAQVQAFVSLVNMLWVASRRPAGSLDDVAATAQLAARTVDLGLAAQSIERTPAALAHTLESWGQVRLFSGGAPEASAPWPGGRRPAPPA